ncbi:hypothetical protein CW304_27980 [Bacillus sp. UFRGS-B20]|nr:hypothetical protein CW304_27980 [Bacillus sp. UFRGS-B20]
MAIYTKPMRLIALLVLVRLVTGCCSIRRIISIKSNIDYNILKQEYFIKNHSFFAVYNISFERASCILHINLESKLFSFMNLCCQSNLYVNDKSYFLLYNGQILRTTAATCTKP